METKDTMVSVDDDHLASGNVRAGVVADLERLGLETPAIAADLGSHLQDVIGGILREEIEGDPMGIGYAGQTPDEIVRLLNSSSREKVRSAEVFTVSAITSNEEKTFVDVVTKAAPKKNELAGLTARFADDTVTEYLRGHVVTILSHVPLKTKGERLTLGAGTLPVEPGDTFMIYRRPELGVRIAQLFVGVPFAPNAVTADQVTKALG